MRLEPKKGGQKALQFDCRKSDRHFDFPPSRNHLCTFKICQATAPGGTSSLPEITGDCYRSPLGIEGRGIAHVSRCGISLRLFAAGGTRDTVLHRGGNESHL